MILTRYIPVLLLFVATAASAQPSELLYRDFLKYSNTSKQDKELRAFVEGLAYAIRSDYDCFDERDRNALRRPEATIEELIAFGKTDWGRLYAERTGQMGVARLDMTVGDVMFKVFTQHSHCRLMAKRREQLTR